MGSGLKPIPTTISRWCEKGGQSPRFNTLSPIAGTLELTVEVLLA